MKRRQFLALSAFALSASTLASRASFAESSNHVDFTQEAYQKALESGEPFMLDFYAPW